mmetsp:Transcript_44630/g.107536  ORF Transcript_44630/g.107536 Transcript_44630/m.107536 type:complete len:1332 (-) Transcript_44630:108-4103(-)
MSTKESTAAAATDSNHTNTDTDTNTNTNTNTPTNGNLENEENHKDIGFLQAKCSLLQNQLSFLRAQQKQKKEQRKKEKGEIVSTFKSMKEYIDHLEGENKQFKALLAPPASSSSEHDEVTVLRQRVLALDTENTELKQRCVAAENQCRELETKCTQLETQVSKSKDTEAQLRDQVLKYEQVVDRVPLIQSNTANTNNNANTGGAQSVSMSVMADAPSFDGSRTGTIEESLFGGAGEDGDGEIKEDLFGKVVDHTPITPSNKGSRGSGAGVGGAKSSSSSAVRSGEDADTVFGVTDRAELASIADLDDEDDEEEDDENGNAGQEWAGSVAADNISLRLDVMEDDNDDDNKNLVDQVPKMGKPKGRGRRKPSSSVAVLPDVSVASGGRMTLDDNTVGDEDNIFGKMVDQTPDLTAPYTFKKTGSSVSFRDNLEDDTVLGVTEKLEIESVARQDDEVSSHGDTGTVDDGLSRDGTASIAGASLISFKLNVAEEKNLVDHVPYRRSKQNHHRQKDASVVAIADNFSTSSPNDDTIADETGRNAFGPIVDQTPSVVAAGAAPMSTKSMATSVVTQNSLFTDLNDDYLDRDADTLGPASTVGDPDWERESSSSTKESKHMVDHVPNKRSKRLPTDLSVRVYADNLDNMSQVDTIAEDEEMEFGPIVDQTPFSASKSVLSSGRSTSGQLSVAGSTMAVGGGDTGTQDYDIDTVQDTFMDTGTIASIQEEEDNSTEEENMVDHVPPRRKMRSNVDESVRVLVDANENMSQVDTIAEDGILDFGPIVDHTPQMGDAVTPSGARSVAASTAAVGDDNRTEGDLESMALHTTATAEVTLGISEGEFLSPLAGEEEEKHVVDHVPREETRPSVEGSVRVVIDHAETLSQVDTVFEDERVAFGPIVDHTPAFTSARSVGRSVGASMISVGTNDDSTSIQDNTTIGFGIGGSVGGGDDTGNLDDNAAPAYTPSANEDKKLVDHVPQSPFPKSGDVSVIVQADPLDAVFEVDDEASNGNVRTDRYGPIVDQTPLMRPPTAPSVATSMLTTTSDAAIDARTEDGTWLSGSTERGDTIGEVNSRDTDLPLGESVEEAEGVGKGPSEAAADISSGQVVVETVQSYDSDDLTDDAYVRVSKTDSNGRGGDDDGKQSIASDEDAGFGLKEMHNYAEELAAKASESKDNPFDIESNPQSSPEKVNSDVQDYIASLASGTKESATENSPEKQKYENVKSYVEDLAKGTDSVTGSVESSTHSVQEMRKYIADLANSSGVQGTGEEATTTAKTSSDPHKAKTPKKKGDASEPDARHDILEEIGAPKKQSVFGKLFRANSKNKKGDKERKQDGTWA